jgi:predicted CXXCH cytochrome family protein
MAGASKPPATGLRRRAAAIAAIAAVAVAVGLVAWWAASPSPGPDASADAGTTATSAIAPAPAAAPTPAWVANATCVGCHADQAGPWSASNHARAMAPAGPDTVRADFAGTRFSHAGVATTFSRRGDRFVVRTDGPDGRIADFDVAWTFGVEPLQQYLVPMPGGRLQPLQVAWDAPRGRWFHLLPDEKAPAGDVLHWTGRYQTANTMCIACHVTGFEKRYDAAADTFASTWAEPNVSCQSCHGPGERHVAWARAKASGTTPPAVAGERAGLVVDFRAAGARGVVDTCAACHSRRSELVASPVPGRPRLDQYLPALPRPPLYHVDGQQDDEVFVDGSFRQSRMYQAGVACTDCHDPHSGRTRAQGNAVCTTCHAAQPNPRFPAAAGAYDAPAHHRHPPGSAGAQCVACHMPPKTYMRIQPRADHSMRVPRPDLSVTLGTPNACTQCHADRDPKWASDAVAAWHGTKRREVPHFGETFAAALAGTPGAHDAVARVAADRAQPPIVRATALDLLRDHPRAGDTARIEATRDPEPEVRAAAADSLEALPPVPRVHGLAPLLADPVRAVRIAAARALSSLPRERIDAAIRPAFDAALAEYEAAQRVSLDMPGARLNLAVVMQNTGRLDEAEREYLAALRIDPDFTPARANLARLYNAGGRNADARKVLEDGLAREPRLGELQYALGLLLAEDGRLPEATAALERAAGLLPQRAKVHYNLGLARQQAGRRDLAAQSLARAHALDPRDADTLYALAVLEAQSARWDRAIEWSERLVAIAPDDARARRLLADLKARR